MARPRARAVPSGLRIPSDSSPVSLTGSDFAFDPRTLMLVPEAGPAQSGLTFDNAGRKLFCDLTRPLRTPMYELRYAARNPFFPWPPEAIDVASPATPVNAWPTVAKESLAASGQGTNPPAPAWLATARGCVVYRGSAFPTNYLGNVFVADPSAHVILRFVLRENGLELAASRAPGETTTEFLASSDPSFHPMQIVPGSDGALYIADAREGGDSGRIYRIVPQQFTQPKPPQLSKASTYDLAATLAHPDGWRRDTAARLLIERRDPAAVPLLTNMVSKSRLPLARLHALHVLDGLDALSDPVVLSGLQDKDALVREHAVLLSEKLLKNGLPSDALWDQLKTMASDSSPRVRYQLAFTLGELRGPNRLPVLAQIIARDPDDPWIRAATLSSLAEGAGEMLAVLAGDAGFRNSSSGWEFLRQLATMIGVKGGRDDAVRVLAFIDRTPLDPRSAFGLLFNLGDGLHRTRSSLALLDPQGRLQRFYTQALAVAVDGTAGEPARIEALRLLGVSPYTLTDVGDMLILIVGSGASPALQSATIATLGRYSDPRLAANLLSRWPVMSAPLRNEAVTALLARSERVPNVMTALENGPLRDTDLTPAQINFLRAYRDPAIQQRALRLLGPIPMQRPDAVKQFKPALTLKGTATRGRQIFLDRCAACHQLGAEGQPLGPDLATAKLSGKENTLAAILEPSAEIRRGYATYAIETKGGESIVGLIGDETPDTITVRQPNGARAVWPRENLQSIEAQTWSLMPAGLEQGLAPQDMADLLEYVMTAPK